MAYSQVKNIQIQRHVYPSMEQQSRKDGFVVTLRMPKPNDFHNFTKRKLLTGSYTTGLLRLLPQAALVPAHKFSKSLGYFRFEMFPGGKRNNRLVLIGHRQLVQFATVDHFVGHFGTGG